MPTLAIDIETYSSCDLIKSGVYKYVEAPDFEVLLFAYSFDGGPVEIVDFAKGEILPYEIVSALDDKSVLKTAYNASFERTCLCKHFSVQSQALPPNEWECTMVKSSMLGLPLGLGAVSKV